MSPISPISIKQTTMSRLRSLNDICADGNPGPGPQKAKHASH
jgi:hypothetical protein